MPVIKQLKDTKYTLLLFHITESEAVLIKRIERLGLILPNLDNVQSKTHRLQKLAVIIMLQELGVYHILFYKASGKPMLRHEALYLSIAHTKAYAAVIISSNPIGLDIECITPKTQRVIPRICNEKELSYAYARNTDLRSTQLFTIKEAVYKYLDTSIGSWKTQICVGIENNQLSGEVAYYSSEKKQCLQVVTQTEKNVIFSVIF